MEACLHPSMEELGGRNWAWEMTVASSVRIEGHSGHQLTEGRIKVSPVLGGGRAGTIGKEEQGPRVTVRKFS